MRRMLRLVTVGALIALQFGAVSPPAHANGTLGSFEIDGNLADDSPGVEPLDWATLPAGTVTNIPDASNSTKDDIFGNGSKELEPGGWSCVAQKPPGKDDIVSGQIAFRRVNGDQFAYVNFFRKDVNGDAHMDFEFNHSSAPASTSCGSVPKRTQGDILIAFDTENGGATIGVRTFRWDGNATTGTFTDVTTSGFTDGAVNIPPSRTIPGHANGDFGEAAINLTRTIGEVSCGEFAGAYMKTRSSTSITAALKDFTKSQPINPDNCPNSSLAKSVRNVTTNSSFGNTATASPGDTLEYRLTYTNAGPGTANNVVVSDTIQAKQTFLSCSQTPPCTTAGTPVTSVSWSLGSVAPGTKVLTFQVRLDSNGWAAGTTAVKDTATVATTQEGSKSSNETTTNVTANPNSALTKAVRDVTTNTAFGTSTDAAPGDTIEYRLTYTNSGNAPATNVVISDPIPNKTTFVSCSNTCTQTGSPVTSVSWTFASVAPGTPVVVTFQVRLDSTGFSQGATVQITNTAQVCTAQEGCKPSNSTTVNVKTPNNTLVKAVRNVTTNSAFSTSTTAAPGNTLEYRLTLTNTGTATATNVVVTDLIQAHQTYLSCTLSCTTDGPPVTTVTWTFATLAPGESKVMTFQVRLDASFPAGTTAVKDTATVTSTQEPTKTSNETTTTVTAAPSSSLAKAVRDVTSGTSFGLATDASPGDTIEYRLTYTNTGNAAASNVVISDPIPNQTTYLSCTGGCTTTGTPVTSVSWTYASVAPGDTKVVTFQVRLDTTGFAAGTTSPITNVATVCTTEEGCKNSPPTTVNVKTPKSTLAKAVRDVTTNGTFSTATTARPGDVIEYRLTYTNTGPGTATNVVISDPIPGHSTYLSCSPACTTNGPPVTTVTWNVGTVGVNAPVVVTFQVTLDSTFPSGTTVITNVGTVTTTEESGSTSSNPTTVTVTAAPNLQLGKSADATGTVVSGTQITYTLTYTNTGNAPATNTVITEAVPAGTTFVACSNSCVVSGSTVTWNVGTVNPGDVGAVTLTVAVNDSVGCQICNIADISSPAQSNGAVVHSNQICINAQPADNPAGAHASGSALGASVKADLSTPLLPLVIDTQLASTSSSQTGVGQDANHDQLGLGPLNPLLVPEDGSVLRADILRVTSTSTVSPSPAKATDLSTAETLGVKVLATVVTADVVQGVASASADGGSSTYSSAGSTFKNLRVSGVAYNNVAPNTTVNVGDILGIGTGITVALREEVGSTSTPSGTSGGIYAADLTVNMIHVHVTDGNLVMPGKQPLDVIVSQAKAHADFPQTRVCLTSPTRLVSGHAFIAGATVLGPDGVAVLVDNAQILPSGGQQDIQTDHADLPDDGSLVTADAAEAFASGGIGVTSTGSYDFASAANVCIKLGISTGCDITATAVRSVSSSSATATARGSADNYNGDTTQLVGLTIGGMDLVSILGLSGMPAPNTVVEIPGVATIVLNEQVCDGNGTLANHCADATTGHAGLTVRSIHVILVAGTPPLADIVVAEAHSDATWK
jgi:uncharacterized repeat protein (TIGR01451 family)